MLTPVDINNQRVVGLDLSTNSIAYSLFLEGELSEYGEITMKGALGRRNYLSNQYARYLRSRLNPDVVAYESAVYIQNKKTVITLAEAAGSVVSSLCSSKTEVRKFIPIEWQNFIGNKVLSNDEKYLIKIDNPKASPNKLKDLQREFRKQRTITWANDKFDIEVVSDNVADAIGVGYTASHKAGVVI